MSDRRKSRMIWRRRGRSYVRSVRRVRWMDAGVGLLFFCVALCGCHGNLGDRCGSVPDRADTDLQACDSNTVQFLERYSRLGAREIRRRGLRIPATAVLRRCVVRLKGEPRLLAADLLVSVAGEELPARVLREFANSEEGRLRLFAAMSALVAERATSREAAKAGWDLLLAERDATTRRNILRELLLRDVYVSQPTMPQVLKRELLRSVKAGDAHTMEFLLERLRRLVPDGPRTEDLSLDEADRWLGWLDTHAASVSWTPETRGFSIRR